MVVAIAPVTGLPAPLLSYGGTFTLSTFIVISVYLTIFLIIIKHCFIVIKDKLQELYLYVLCFKLLRANVLLFISGCLS